MALVVADRVQETTTTTGTGTYTLAGAKDGFQSFAAVGDNNTTYYACTDGTDYEVGIGTYTASGTTLARTTIIESSNSDAAVNWGAGSKDIFVTLPASKATVLDASGNATFAGNITVSGTVDGVDIATNIPSSLGTAGQVLTVNSGATAGEWASLPSVSLAEQEFTATSGQTVFTVTGGITDADNVSVYLNGAKLFSTDVTISAAANTVTLASGATTGDLVTVTEVAGAASSGGSGGSGVTVHSNQAAMLTDAASASEGSLHYETDNNRLYVKQSSGFYLLASITNASPTIDSFSEDTGGAGANSLTAGGTFTLTSGSNTVVTINATEPDLETIVYSATVTSGTATDVFSSPSFPVTNQSSNVFTLTPATSGTGGTVTIRFDASDGTNVANVSHSFEIAFVIANSHYTSLLMATVGSAGDNNDITDSSSSNHTITVNGDTHAGTFSPYRHGGYSTYFDGSGDYLSLASSTDFTLDGDFTIDFWVNILDSNIGAIVSSGQSSFVSGASALIWDHGTQVNKLSFWAQNISSTSLVATNTLDLNRWYFISVVRDNGVITIYQDGASVSTYNSSSTISLSASGMRIGAYWNGQVNAYITDFRIVKGTAITPASGGPTERLTAVTNTKLLTCHLPYIADGSSSAHSITVNGNPETKPFGPYDYSEYSESINGGSVYFDGNDYLSIAHSTDLDLGTGNFTIEGWWRFDDTSNQNLVSKYAGGQGFVVQYQSGNLRLVLGLGGSDVVYSFSWTPVAGTWYHVCILRDGTNGKAFINGTQIGSTTTVSTSNVGTTGTLQIGLTHTVSEYTRGHVSDVRIVKGTAVYSGAFTPPTGPLTTTGGTYPSATNVNTSITSGHTKLLLKGTDAHVIDKSQSANLKLVGTAAAVTNATNNSNISSTNAVSFDGNSDYVRVPYESIPSFGAGEFTIEGWIYMNNLSGNQIIVDKYASGNSQSFQIYYRSTGTSLTFYVGSSVLLQDPSSSTISVQTWHHFAVTRDSSGNVRLYVDGLKKAQSTSNVSFDSTVDLHLGVQGSTSTNYFNGYMQDVRLSNKAFYTADDHSASSSASIKIPSAPLKG